jgi:protein-L-isoaspartate(D-aspartate) O-methyltransferase
MSHNTSDIFSDDFSSREELLRRLKEDSRVFSNPRIEKAFEAVDRKKFVEVDYSIEAYEDYALPIRGGQTISQPTTIAFMLELLDVEPGHTVLDVGSGSGYSTALLSELVGEKGKVIGIEVVPELVEHGATNTQEYPQASIYSVKPGFNTNTQGPFDRILVSASVEKLPEELVNQLKEGGVMVVPVGDVLTHVIKKEDDLEIKEFPGFQFVPFKY